MKTAHTVAVLKSSRLWPFACEISSPDLASDIGQDRLVAAI